MNDEIKEILDYLSNDNIEKPFGIATIDKHRLLDYITNLQHTEDLYNQLLKDYDELEQAYQELKDSKEWWNNRFNAVQRDYEDYKSRCEKAIKYIMSELVDEWSIKNDGYVSGSDLPVDAIIPLLNILNGRSDE